MNVEDSRGLCVKWVNAGVNELQAKNVHPPPPTLTWTLQRFHIVNTSEQRKLLCVCVIQFSGHPLKVMSEISICEVHTTTNTYFPRMISTWQVSQSKWIFHEGLCKEVKLFTPSVHAHQQTSWIRWHHYLSPTQLLKAAVIPVPRVNLQSLRFALEPKWQPLFGCWSFNLFEILLLSDQSPGTSSNQSWQCPPSSLMVEVGEESEW